MSRSRRIKFWLVLLMCCLALEGVNVALHFPYDTDAQSAGGREKAAAEFYKTAYAASKAQTREEREQEEIYVRVAEGAAKAADIDGLVRQFAARYGLQDKRVLEVGAGRGYLQDVVANYVGLDISPTAQRYFHKPFVLASATAMPFRDNEFDAVWTIWVLEHVPNPESALNEIRRVVKPGGVILLKPAWVTGTWLGQGYEFRPYSDFGFGGKLTKASIPLRRFLPFRVSYILPIRIMRLVAAKVDPRPTSFHYTRLEPNYQKYWGPDSDAVNSMDPSEMVLWFESRGDQCLNCPGGIRNLSLQGVPLVIRIGKKG
jgi:SAM-dependent methyltransferase